MSLDASLIKRRIQGALQQIHSHIRSYCGGERLSLLNRIDPKPSIYTFPGFRRLTLGTYQP